MIPGITEVNFPAYATLHEATITLAEMGENIITARIKIDGDIVPDFSDDWKVIYKEETFVLSSHTPQASKDTSSRCSFIDATFTSFPVAELRRYFFVGLSEVETGTMIVDKYIATLRLNARDFIAAFNRVLAYYFGDMFSIVINADAELSGEVKEVPLDYTYLWDALTSSLYDIYGLTWKLTQSNGKYIIRVGDPLQTVSDHIFEYGFEGGLMRIERQLQDAEIYNQLLGRGGTKNLPYRYFKKTDPYNEIWAADPDACAELENVYFERLMDINFRYYIKGWLRNPNRTPSADYPVPSTPEPAEIQQHWAYQKGLTDAKFQPVEYVEDAASVAEYGVRQGKLEDDDEIFPTIQGITVSPYGRIDEIVAVGAITDGDDSGVNQEISLGDITKAVTTDTGLPTATFDFYGPAFSVPAGLRGEIRYKPYMSDDTTGAVEPNFAYAATINTDYTKIVAERISDGEQFPISSVPGGDDYRLKITFVMNKFPTDQQTSRVVGLQDVRLFLTQTVDANDNPYCFRVWVKNIWQTAKGANESALEYMKRVWEPILGDRLGNEAKIVFSDGWMSVSSDYEFTIMDWPVFDQSKTLNGVQSEWMLTLAKSDAEVDSTGKYIPNATSAKPVAGDHFFFTGIDMPHIYVLWAEKKLNEKKQEALDTEAYANPTWAVQLDPVRIETLLSNENVTLMSQLSVGKVMKIYDPRFSGGQVLGLAIRSMTITWHEGAVMRPSVDVVLSENVLSRTPYGGAISPSSINAQIDSAISRMGAASQKSFLSKEHDDVAVGKLRMAAGATFGAIGDYDEGAQQTAMEVPAASIDESGHAEFDSMRLRKWLEVPEMRYNRTEVQVGNQWRAPGGGIIGSVTPDIDGQGNVLNTGTVNLKLEEGEIGKVAVDDICMGIFHDSINENSNAVADLDDSKGNFHFSGFYTTYFRITEVLGANNQCFRYVLRPTSTSWTETFHPCAQMHFVCYGNFDGVNHADRQSSRYSTRTYERYLKNVNTWEFQASNVAAQFGELSNLADLRLPGMSGYSTYIENIYMTGAIKQMALPFHIEMDWTGQNMLDSGSSADIAFNVMQGFDNMNADVASWSISRDSGDATADAAWAQTSKALNFNGAITLEFSDLGTSGISTLFTVAAIMNDTNHTRVEYGFTMMAAADSPVYADLSNEMEGIAVGSDGKTTSALTLTTIVSMYYGTTQLPLSSIVVSGLPSNRYTATVNTATGQVQIAIQNNTAVPTNAAITITVTGTYGAATYTRSLTFTIAGITSGTQGQDAVIYSIIPSVTSIKKNKSGAYSVSSVSCVKRKRVGQQGMVTTTDGSLYYVRDDGDETIYSSAVSTSGLTKGIMFLYYVGGVLVDRENVPVVIDGTDGEDGQDGIDGADGNDGDGTRYAYYKAAASDAAPSAPSSAPTETGTAYRTWYKSPPTMSARGDRIFSSVATYDGATKTWSAYSTPVIWANYAKDGDPGDPGPAGQGYDYAYYKVNATGTAPTTGPTSKPSSAGTGYNTWYNKPPTMSEQGDRIFVSFSTTYNASTGAWSSYSTPVLWAVYSKDGEPGSQGTAGPALVYRGDWSSISSATFYRTSARADVVKYSNNYYICKTQHTKTSSSSWDSSKWDSFGASFDSVATGLLLAKVSYIDNLGTKLVRLLNSGGDVVGGMSPATSPSGANSQVLWIGSASKSTNAPFYVTATGQLKATNADIEGKITATSGEIGGLTVGSDYLGYGSSVKIWAEGTGGDIGSLGISTKNRQNLFESTSASYVPLNLAQSAAAGVIASLSGGSVEMGSGLKVIPNVQSGNYTILKSDLFVIMNPDQSGRIVYPPTNSPTTDAGRMFIIYNASNDYAVTVRRSTASQFNIYRNGSATTSATYTLNPNHAIILIAVNKTNYWLCLEI